MNTATGRAKATAVDHGPIAMTPVAVHHQSMGEAHLASELRWLKFIAPEREYRFSPPRRWRFDFAWPDHKLAVEVEGGTWSRSRHTGGAGFRKDCEKYNEAIISGWRVLRVTTEQVTSGEAIDWIQRALYEEPITWLK